MEDKINIAREKLEITFPLKEKQMETLQHVYEGKDCISVLPTFLSHDLKFRKQFYLSATYLRGYWKISENGRVVTIVFCMFSGRVSIVKMKVEKPANVLNNYLRIPQNAIYTEKHQAAV